MSGPIDWGISWITSRLFAFSPKVYSDKKGMLIARTSWKANLFSLGFAGRSVAIDRNREMIRLRKRAFWFAKSDRFFPFASIEEVLYGYKDIDLLQSMSWAHQQDDLFVVGLKLHTREEITLFKFYGQGDFSNDGPLPDWMYWEDILESKITKGGQEGQALTYAEIISTLVGVPIGTFAT
ncbi:MAG: hypothetical protein H7Y17_04080 [Chlorobia bacterium]|nr:hypothetical protein [Fimbriimonadaceae bacterium]